MASYPGLSKVEDPATRSALKSAWDQINGTLSRLSALEEVAIVSGSPISARNQRIMQVGFPEDMDDAITLRYARTILLAQSQGFIKNVITVPGSTVIPWDNVSKGGSDLADLETRNARDLTGAVGNTAVQAGDTISNTAVETAFATSIGTTTANRLVAGDAYRVTISGLYGTVGGGTTLRLRFKMGAVTILDTNIRTVGGPITAEGWGADVLAIFFTVGAGGTVEVQGRGEFGTGPLATLVDRISNAAPIAVDTTIAQALTVTAQWGAANVANTITLRQTVLERLLF